MATSTQATVLNLLVQKLNGLLPFALPASSEPVYIIDGSPGAGPNYPDNLVCIMPFPEDGTNGSGGWRDPTKARDEYYAIQIRIRSYVGGAADPNTMSTAQYNARANASTIEAAIEAAILADPNLAIENGGTAPITQFGGGERRVSPIEVEYSQTNIDDDDGKGRFAEYLMTLNVYNYLTGA